MADIKITESFLTELQALSTAAESLKKKTFSLDGVSTLPACKAFAQIVEDISAAIVAYKQLVDKDVAELTEFADEMKKLDEA